MSDIEFGKYRFQSQTSILSEDEILFFLNKIK